MIIQPKRLTVAALLLAGAAALAGCQRETGPDPLELTGKMFIFNYRLAYATYMITLTKTEPVPEGSTVVATFENPAGGAPLTLDRKLFAKLDKVVLESPDVTCVKKAAKAIVASVRPGGLFAGYARPHAARDCVGLERRTPDAAPHIR